MMTQKVFFLALFMFICAVLPAPARSGRDTAGMSPRVRIILWKAQHLIEKEEYDLAADLLIGFKTKRLQKSLEKGGYELVDFTIGNCLLKLGRKEEALGYYKSALKIRPHFYEARINLAKCEYDLGMYPEAAESFLDAFESAPAEKKPDLLYYAAVSFISCKRYKDALPLLERLFEMEPEKIKPEWEKSIVNTYLALGMSQKALPFIEELAGGADRPLEPEWWKALVHLHLKDKRYKKALVALTIKELLSPLTDEETVLAGDLNLFLGMPAQALEYYERSLARRMDPDLLVKAVECHIRLDRVEEALALVEKGLRFKRDPRFFMLRGNLFFDGEEFLKAASDFVSAAQLGVEDPGEAWLMAGYASWYAGDVRAAEKAFKKAAGFEKSRKAAEEMLARTGRAASLNEQKGTEKDEE